MSPRSTKAWTIAILICCLIAQGALDGHAAQKQAELLWYKTVEVKRVTKPNRKLANALPTTQILQLLTLQLRLFEGLKRGRIREVDSKTVFKTKDQLKVGITPNQDGYLYFILTNAQGGQLRNDRILVRSNKQYLAPSVCPGSRKPANGCFFEFAPPAPASGFEELVIIFSRNMITNIPSAGRDRVSFIRPEVLEEIKARSGQIVTETPGGIAKLLGRDSGRFAMLVQNTSQEDNEELVVTLQLKHRD